MTTRPVIVVGTGRCGSTLLSNMIRLHPDLLSVSEMFSFLSDLGTRIEQVFPLDPISGAEFWQLLSAPQPRQSILLANELQMSEVIYPWGRGRFAPNELPPISQAMLPHLDHGDPDQLFDLLASVVPGWGTAPVGQHFEHLFHTLAQRFEKVQWVERSGGSLRVVERLAETFPDAVFVHLVRDGRDTALSMSRHIGFRMAILCGLQAEQLGVDPYESTNRDDEADLADELADTLPENFTKEAFEKFDLPPSLCGHYWSGEIVAGLKALDAVAQDSAITVRYEDLLADPTNTIESIGAFAGFEVPQQWVSEAAGLVRKMEPRWAKLPLRQQADLSNSCKAGFDALAEVGVTWQ